MRKAKLSYIQWEKIQRYKKTHIFQCMFCNFTMTQADGNSFKVTARVKWFWHILFFIPFNLLNFFYSLWDGGLREYQISVSRYVTHSFIYENSSVYDYCEVIWDAKSKD